METKTIGSFIAILRKANGLTQKQLAEKLCVSDKTVSRWERDETTPDLSLIPVIAEIFNVTSDELLRGERKQHTAEVSGSEGRSEKQIQHILAAAKTKCTTQTILAILIALVSWIISIGFSMTSIEEAAVVFALVGALIGIAFQITSTITVFSSINSEAFTGPQVEQVKRQIFRTAMVAGCGIATFAACTLPGVVLYDVMEGVFLGFVWGGITFGISFGVCMLVKYNLISRGHTYLDPENN